MHWAVERLKAQAADIIVLSELPSTQIAAISLRLQDYPYQEVVSPSPVGSLAVFSKHPISDFEELNQGAFAGRPQGIMHIDYRSGFKLMIVHASAPWTYPRYRKRNRQLSALAQLANTLDDPLLMIGDFNASHRRKELKTLKASMSECRGGLQRLASWPMFGSFWCIDHVFYSEHFQMKQFERLNFLYSDHLPVFAEFDLN